MTVAMIASCFSCRSFTPPGDSLSARGTTLLIVAAGYKSETLTIESLPLVM